MNRMKDRSALVALLDAAMAEAVRAQSGTEISVVDFHVSFVQQGTGPFSARGQVNGGGRSLCFCEAEVLDADGRVVAKAMGTLRAQRADR